MEKILILCTGNSVRSQMAEGIMRSLSEGKYDIYSAGTNPAEQVNPDAIEVMKEIGIDISGQYPKNVDQFLSDSFNYVVTVCDSARESCPFFSGTVKKRIHMSFEDPSLFKGKREDVLNEYRRIRDQINEWVKDFMADAS